jgi:hypothetical protein
MARPTDIVTQIHGPQDGLLKRVRAPEGPQCSFEAADDPAGAIDLGRLPVEKTARGDIVNLRIQRLAGVQFKQRPLPRLVLSEIQRQRW